MPPDRVDHLLDEFASLTATTPRPASRPAPTAPRMRLPAAALSGVVVIVAAVAVLGILAGRPGPASVTGPSSSTSARPSSPPAVTSSTPTVQPTIGLCDPASLAARITGWEGAAGQRIATVELVNRGSAACLLEARGRPQLLAGDGGILIDGRNPATTTILTVEPGATLRTEVAAGNDCRPAPLPPVRVAIVLGDGRRIVADPATPTDATVPPCLGPGQPGTIDMHPWAP